MLSFLDFTPTEKQAQFMADTNKYKLFGGSMGAGKSVVLCACAIQLSLLFPRNRGYLCRHEYTSFKKTTYEELKDLLYGTGLIAKENKTEGELLFKNGSTIIMGGLENPDKLKSLNLGWFGIDEATETTLDIFQMLATRLRHKAVPSNRYFGLLATNPEPGWVKDEFVDPFLLNKQKPNYSFIQALPTDNPHLPEGYIDDLRVMLKPLQVTKYLEGSWDVFEAQIFPHDFIRKSDPLPKSYQSIFMAVDPAITESDDDNLDETAICVMGIDDNDIIHEIETRHGRWSFQATINNCKELYNFYEPNMFGVEKVAYQAALIQKLNDEKIPALPLKADRDKTRRAYSIQYMFENGRVRINNDKLIKQMLEFPEGAKHGGHEDLCFVAGTKIATKYGYKNIKDITINDKIITPLGLRDVIKIGKTGKRAVINKCGLIGTPKHKIFSLDTFVYLCDTNPNDINKLSLGGLLEWRYRELLCSMEKGTKEYQRRANIIFTSQQQIKKEKVLKDFMSQLGSFIINAQFQKAGTFTTKMVILLTTTLKTWSVFQGCNIKNYIHKSLQKNKSNTLTRSDLLLKNGTNQKKDESGISSMERNAGKIEKKSTPIPVKNVAKHTPPIQIEAGSAQKTVPYATIEKTTLKNSEQLTRNTERKEKVYNLTVADDGVYYANNVLVSNCDAMIYNLIMIKNTSAKARTPKEDKLKGLKNYERDIHIEHRERLNKNKTKSMVDFIYD